MQLFGNANPDTIEFFSLLSTSQHSGSCCHFQGALMPLSDTYVLLALPSENVLCK